jgi:Predicted bile acid beta-glucosidase
MKNKLSIILAFFLIFCGKTVAQFSPDHLVSPEKGDITSFVGDINNRGDRKIYKGDELLAIGMPCGGIAAGQLYVRGDGTLANWWIANNAYNTGRWSFDTPHGPWKAFYQTFEPFSYIDQGFKIVVDDGRQKLSRELSKKDFDDISFIGEYPVAYVTYQSKKENLPVIVSSRVFSPFIPLNAKESATPATILQYTVKNTSAGPLKIELTGWMQNLVCIDLKERLKGSIKNEVIASGSKKSVYMTFNLNKKPAQKEDSKRQFTVFEDFESGTYDKWKVEGDVFGDRPASGPFGNQPQFGCDYGKYLANSCTNFMQRVGKMTSGMFTVEKKYISFNISGSNNPRSACLNLIIDGKIVKSATGNNDEEFLPQNWDVSEWKGKEAHFEIVDNAEWGHISVDNIEFSDQQVPIPMLNIDENHPYYGNLALTVFDGQSHATANQNTPDALSAEALLGEKLNGALTSSFQLKPGESKEITFVLSWYFPNRPLNYNNSIEAGWGWGRPLPPLTPPIGNMYANWFNSSLDVVDQLQTNFDRLTKETMNFHDTYYNQSSLPYWLIHRIMMPVSTLATETCQWWATDKFWAWEGVGSCIGTCTHVWNYEQAMAALFPEFERNLREKTDYGVSFQQDGSVLSRNGGHGVMIDGHAGAILKIYREHLMSSNNFLLTRNWDKIKKSLEYIINEDENEDGMIEKTQPNTYDISFHGGNTYVGSLYLAALRAGEKMATIMNDQKAADRYKQIYEAGTKTTMERLWNGEYFIQDVDEKKHPKNQYVKGCLSDQLFGQTWADLLRLGDLYPAESIDKALNSIWLYNWTNDVKAQSEAHKPERFFANSGEPGLFICTWPYSKHPGGDGVRYRDEVWTGIEYQVATEMIYRGKTDKALTMVKAIHSRYDGAKHNPWNEIECGDHYARAMASWGVLSAIQDYWYNGPQGVISFAPRIKPDNFKGFFTSAEGWGNITQTIAGGKQSNGIYLKYGRLVIQKVLLSSENVKNPKSVSVTLDGETIPCKISKEGDYFAISFDKLTVNRDMKLIVEIN